MPNDNDTDNQIIALLLRLLQVGADDINAWAAAHRRVGVDRDPDKLCRRCGLPRWHCRCSRLGHTSNAIH